MAEPTLPQLSNPGGSGFGVSFWSSFYRCPRRLWLDTQLRQGGFNPPPTDVPEPQGAASPTEDSQEDEGKDEEYVRKDWTPQDAADFLTAAAGRPNYAKRGQLIHKLCELRHTTGLAGVPEFIYPDPTNMEWAAACRAFSAYCEKYPIDEFKVLGCEVPFIIGRIEDLHKPPEEWDPVVRERFGVPVITGRIDMVPSIEAGHVEMVRESRGIPIYKEGVYTLDYKSMSQLSKSWVMEMVSSFQFNLYNQAYEIITGVRPHGTIASGILFYKKQSDIVLKGLPNAYAPFPNKFGQQALKTYLSGAYARFKAFGESAPNQEMCFIYKGMPCQHFVSGLCNRS